MATSAQIGIHSSLLLELYSTVGTESFCDKCRLLFFAINTTQHWGLFIPFYFVETLS